jgi:hypothetical protein
MPVDKELKSRLSTLKHSRRFVRWGESAGLARDFYTKFGFEILCDNNGRARMFMPMSTVAQLFEEE